MESNTNIIEIGNSQQDQITIQAKDNGFHISFVGCVEFSEIMFKFKKNFGPDIKKWPLPQGHSHSELIIKELILKLTNKWDYPYKDSEICHCRHVPTSVVDNAIIQGAHTLDLASQWTGCSTACGTCKPDVEKIIQFRIETK